MRPPSTLCSCIFNSFALGDSNHGRLCISVTMCHIVSVPLRLRTLFSTVWLALYHMSWRHFVICTLYARNNHNSNHHHRHHHHYDHHHLLLRIVIIIIIITIINWRLVGTVSWAWDEDAEGRDFKSWSDQRGSLNDWGESAAFVI